MWAGPGERIAKGGPRILIQKLSRCNILHRRNLSLHEYQSMGILEEKGIPVPKGFLASNPQEAASCFSKLSAKSAVVKAQILAGGRGRGIFSSGLQGGIQVVNSKDEAEAKASSMIGHKLITKQTGSKGNICNSVFLVEKFNVKKEYYFALTLDRSSAQPMIITSSKGGVSIEAVAQENPEVIYKHPVDPGKGLTRVEALLIAKELELGELSEEAATIFEDLYTVFVNTDSTLLEINPLAHITKPNGEDAIVCMDAKISIDDNAELRQGKLFAMKDNSQVEFAEIEASKWDLNYIKLDGNISCMVNGAGLAMATMDLIKLNGGMPANFLDIGGTAQAEQVIEAFKILLSDPNSKAVLINIFGGIVRCDVVAQGIVDASKLLSIKVPLVVRLQGTNVDKAKDIIAQSNLPIVFISDLDSAAKKAVQYALGGKFSH